MELFPQYRPSSRTATGFIRLTQKLGLIPIFIALFLMFGKPQGAGPGLWAAFGLGIGLELLLWGASELRPWAGLETAAGKRLAAGADDWFPLFLVGVQTAFVYLAMVPLWSMVAELAMPSAFWIHLNIALIALLIPVYRIAREGRRVSDLPRPELRERFVRYLGIVLCAVLAAGTWTWMNLPDEGSMPRELWPLFVIAWLLAILVILACVALFIDHWLRLNKAMQAPPSVPH